MIPTNDPRSFIEEQRHEYRRYRHVDTGRRFICMGECGFAGSEFEERGYGPCMEGGPTPNVGPPEGRLDVAVTPELECALCVNRGLLSFDELPRVRNRIIVPALRDDCPAAQALRVERLLPEVRLVGDDLAYGRLLQDVYGDALRLGYGFTVVEHDVVPWPGALAALWGCPQEWCGYDYLVGHGQIGGGLGCAYFSKELVARYPDLADGWHEVTWTSLDGHIHGQLRERGVADYHEHWPPVGHAPAYAEDAW